MLQQIVDASRDSLVVCFVGVGSAFAKKNDQTSLIIAKNGVKVLIDIGTTGPVALARMGIGLHEFDYYHITHSHADHIGGIEELLLMSRYVHKRKPKIIITPDYQHQLWDSLRGGCAFNESPPLSFEMLAEMIRPTPTGNHPREMSTITIGDLHLEFFRTLHVPGNVGCFDEAAWSTGVLIDRQILFSGDTRFDPSLFTDLDISNVEQIFHDCQLFSPGTVHAAYDELKTLPAELKSRMLLIHYGDNFDKFNPQDDGFVDFGKAWKLYKYPQRQWSSPVAPAAAR